MTALGPALTTLAATLVLVPVARHWGRRLGVCAQPSADRWHRQAVPIPKTGGAAMLGALAIALLVWPELRNLWPLAMLSGLMFVVGFVDDIRPTRPTTKLVGQLLVAAAFVYVVGPATITGVPAFDLPLTFAWIIGITNAFNLLDNMDGLASGNAAIASAFVAVILMNGPAEFHAIGMGAAALAGACVAFLVFNLHPASVFMGDSGSHLLGSFVAGMTLMTVPAGGALFSPATIVPVVILLVPIVDTAFVTLTRSLSGRNAFVGGRDHLSHRLAALGMGDRRAVFVLHLLAAIGGFVALSAHSLSAPTAWGLAAFYGVILLTTAVYLGHVQSAATPDAPGRPPLPTEVTNRYRIYEVLVDAMLLAFAYYAALVVRFREPELSTFIPYFYKSLPVVVGVQLVPLWLSGKYRQTWRDLGPRELFLLGRALFLGVGLSVLALLYLPGRFEGYSRVVFVYDALFAAGLVISARVGLGALDHYVRLRRNQGRATIIVGAGRGGVLAVHELLQNTDLALVPIGFVDDDPAKRRLRIEGLPVLGTVNDLAALIERTKAGAVVVSIRDLTRESFERICVPCREAGVDVRRMRFALEDVSWRDEPPGVVRFPGA